MERCGNTVLGNTDARQDGASVHGCTDVQYRGMHTCVHTHADTHTLLGSSCLRGEGPRGRLGCGEDPSFPQTLRGWPCCRDCGPGRTLCPMQQSPKPRADERTRVHHVCQLPSRSTSSVPSGFLRAARRPERHHGRSRAAQPAACPLPRDPGLAGLAALFP